MELIEVEEVEIDGVIDVGPEDPEAELYGCEMLGLDDVPVLTIELYPTDETVPPGPFMPDDPFEYVYEAEENDDAEQLPILLPDAQLALEFEVGPVAAFCRAFIRASTFAVDRINNMSIIYHGLSLTWFIFVSRIGWYACCKKEKKREQ